jgi:outer membrane protein OmpU
MKKAVLSTTALLGAGLANGALAPALAEEPIKLSVGGFFREAYMFVIDDDAEGEPGDEHTNDGFFNDAEIHFTGRTVLDNGLEVGARVELEGETTGEGGDQIDEAWIYFAGGFGEFRIGSDDEALANACILPPGGTANFSAFSPNQWGANAFPFTGVGSVTNSACTGVDNKSDAQKIIYITPVFAGFQLTASYTPEPNAETHLDGVGPHVGMPAKAPFGGDADYDTSFYLTYFYAGDDWDITLGGGGSFEGDLNDNTTTDFEEQDFYQGAIVLNIDRFSIGGVFEYYNDIEKSRDEFAGFFFEDEWDAWVAGGGIAYTYNAWTFGAQYSYREDTLRFESSFSDETKDEFVQQRAVATVNYTLGPGINIDGEVGYTWRDQDPEAAFPTFTNDDYEGLEFGIGTALSF